MVERFVYDSEHVWADIDGSGDVTARYLYADAVDEVLARYQTGNGVAWYLTDHLGSVRDIADADGDVVDHLDYDSFGNVVAETSPAYGDRIKFTGREYDPETGLYYYRARYFDPATGRFTTQDPIGFAAGDANPYRYVGNQPLVATDPSGLAGELVFTATAVAYDLQLAESVNGFTFGYACGFLDAFYSGDPNPSLAAMFGAVAGYAIGSMLMAAPLKQALMMSVAIAIAGVSSIADAAVQENTPLLEIRATCFLAPLARTAIRGLFERPWTLRTTPSPEATRIANGHAWAKHQGEFPELSSADEFAGLIDGIMKKAAGSDVKSLAKGRQAFWDGGSNTVVILDPNSPDLGTAFRPKQGRSYFDNLK